ncbi:hypothetical protein EL17_06015 [Anditalea andensis]|uniref:Uncharacterized protein n=1 Tax=Anditalea andensis TaxID=1048983 RepID=A0A074L233_9BACT|nr:hypothetical protein EL17_06015 [Anditalea andensis]
MNLNNLKPAWKQFLLFNSMQPLDQNEILSIIEKADRHTKNSTPSLMLNTIMLIVLLSCFQGG